MLVYECVMIMFMLCKSSYARLTPKVLQPLARPATTVGRRLRRGWGRRHCRRVCGWHAGSSGQWLRTKKKGARVSNTLGRELGCCTRVGLADCYYVRAGRLPRWGWLGWLAWAERLAARPTSSFPFSVLHFFSIVWIQIWFRIWIQNWGNLFIGV